MERYAYTLPNRRRENRNVRPNTRDPSPRQLTGGTSANDHKDLVPFVASSSRSSSSPPHMTLRQMIELITSQFDQPQSIGGMDMDPFAASPPRIEAVPEPPSSLTIAASKPSSPPRVSDPSPSSATDGNPSSPPRNGDNKQMLQLTTSHLDQPQSIGGMDMDPFAASPPRIEAVSEPPSSLTIAASKPSSPPRVSDPYSSSATDGNPSSPPRNGDNKQMLQLTTSHLDQPQSIGGMDMDPFAASPPRIEAVSEPPSSLTIAASKPSSPPRVSDPSSSSATDGNPSSPPRNGDNNKRQEASLSPLFTEESAPTTKKELKVGPLSQKDLILREKIKRTLCYVKVKPSGSDIDCETPVSWMDIDDKIFDDETVSYRDNAYKFITYWIYKIQTDNKMPTVNRTEDGPCSQPSNEAVLDPPSSITIAASKPSSPPTVPDPPSLLATAGESSSPPRVPDPPSLATAGEPSSPPRNGANLDVSSSLATTSKRLREGSFPLSQEESVATTNKRQKVGPSSSSVLEDKPSEADPILNHTEDGPCSQPSNKAVLDPTSSITIIASKPASPPRVLDPPSLLATAGEPSSLPRNGANLDVSTSHATTSKRQKVGSSFLSQEESVATTNKRQKVGPSSSFLLEDKPSDVDPRFWEKIKSKLSPYTRKPDGSVTDHQTTTPQIDKDVIPDETTSYMDKAYQFLLSSFGRKRRDN